MVLADRLDKDSGFLDLDTDAEERTEGGRRGGRVELRYALAEKFGERKGAKAGSARRDDDDEAVVDAPEGAIGACEAIPFQLACRKELQVRAPCVSDGWCLSLKLR